MKRSLFAFVLSFLMPAILATAASGELRDASARTQCDLLLKLLPENRKLVGKLLHLLFQRGNFCLQRIEP